MKNPNIIMITLDGARIDKMRNLQNFKKLSQQSTFFSNTITYAPYTIGSMYAVFSGAYGYNNGVNSYYASPNFKKDSFETIASCLKSQGYYTEADVLNLICVPKKGFDEFNEHDAENEDLLIRHSKLLEKMKQLEKPFFLFLHYSKIQNNIKINVAGKFNNFSKDYYKQKEKNSSNYDKYAKEADEYLGNILDKIEKLKLDDAILIIHSDHGVGIGEKFGEKAYGVYCYDYTLKTFTIFRKRNLFPTKEIILQTRTIDILPTLLDYLGIKLAGKVSPMDGKSMKNLIEGEHEERISYSETGNPYPDPKTPPKLPNVKAVRTNNYKFIRNLWDNNSEELYNLKEDPFEENNLIKKNPKKAKEMRDLLNFHIKESLKTELKDKIKL